MYFIVEDQCPMNCCLQTLAIWESFEVSAFQLSAAIVLEPSIPVMEFLMALVIPDKPCDIQMKLTSLKSESLGMQTKQGCQQSQRRRNTKGNSKRKIGRASVLTGNFLLKLFIISHLNYL